MRNKRKRTCDNQWKLSFQLIKRITNNFSEEIGHGAFGQVFKGVLEDGEEVAVKMLRFMGNINDQQFENEFEILKRLNHPNIVRLVGFCDEAEEEVAEYKGKLIVCQRIHRALCLEYMPRSLGKLLSGENLGKDWPIRHKIIKGICKGLEYLQEGLKYPIFHLDLKPDNILLGQLMLPKISDFGLSRLIGKENTKMTLTPLGTIGYLPPEFINYQVISKEYDIYSLGVIITKIMVTGITEYSNVADMGAQEFVDYLHETWKKYLQEIPGYESLEVDCKQVKRCIEIARRCMENNRHKRPTIKDIVSHLDDIDRENCKLDSPLQLGEGLTIVQVPRADAEADELVCHLENNRHKRPTIVQVPRAARRQSLNSSSAEPSIPIGESCRRPRRLRLSNSVEELLSHNDSASDITHLAHPEHKPKLMTDAGALFLCDGCKEPGYGPSDKRDFGGGEGQSLDLHMRCALAVADDPLFGLPTVAHPLFGYGKQFEFRFFYEPPPPVDDRICDACGQPTRGYVYHCSEQDLHLHPCCASLPDRFLHDGCAFDLHRRASRPCILCAKNKGCSRWFWAYTSYLDGEVVDLHVACLKETARRCWDVGDGALSVDAIVENRFTSIGFGKSGEIAGTVASFIMALVLGNPIASM